MSVLSSLLPGVRELRAPATAGYLWLLLAWMIVDPNLSDVPKGSLESSLYDLGTELGPIGIAVALSLATYLVGSVSQEISSQALKQVLVYRTGPEADRLEQRARDVFGRAWSEVPQDQQEEPLSSEYHGKLGKACDEIVEELLLPPALLVGEHEAIFGEVDRLAAEGDFRTAIFPPLVALSLYLTLNASAIWIVGLLAAGILAAQGIERATQGRRIIASALALGRVESPALKRHEPWLERLPRV